MRKKRILILEPYYGGSHQTWLDGLVSQKAWQQNFETELFTLPARHWKWRMLSSAIDFAQLYLEYIRKNPEGFSIILANDMLDLNTFLSLAGPSALQANICLYMHENQFSYPFSPNDRDKAKGRDYHYGFIHIRSMLAANKIFFNSQYHLKSFFTEAEKLLKTRPDKKYTEILQWIRRKSYVLYPGVDQPNGSRKKKDPVILWNHRWEYDKNPVDFFNVLKKVREDTPFKLIILGENFRHKPEEFEQAKHFFHRDILYFGFVPSRHEYLKWVAQATLLPVTAYQDNFGISTVEAILAGALPILPARLSYPELLPVSLHRDLLYTNLDDLYQKIVYFCKHVEKRWEFAKLAKEYASRFLWEKQIHEYIKWLSL